MQDKTLFMLQTEWVDAKVEVQVSKAIAPVIEQIVNLRQEMHQQIGSLRGEMHEMRQEFGARLTAVETCLGMRLKNQQQVREHFLDYSFKVVWLIVFAFMSGVFSFLGHYLHSFF